MDRYTPCSDGYLDPVEIEVLEHYEINRERHKGNGSSSDFSQIFVFPSTFRVFLMLSAIASGAKNLSSIW